MTNCYGVGELLTRIKSDFRNHPILIIESKGNCFFYFGVGILWGFFSRRRGGFPQISETRRRVHTQISEIFPT